MTGDLPQPGWYEDPRGEAELRWWDGAAWTGQTTSRPGPAPGAGVPPTGPAGPVTPAAGPAPEGTAGPRPPRPRVQPPAGPGRQPSIEIDGRSRPLAPWWPRAVAYVIDALIRLAFTLPFIAVAVVVSLGIDWQAIDLEKLQAGETVDGRIPGLSAADTARLGGAFLVLIAGSLLVELTYQPMTMARRGKNNGRTWGMQAMTIRVVRDNGSPMTYGPALVREFLVMGLLYGLVSAVGNAVTVVGGSALVLVFYLWPLWDAQNRAVQDFICSTHVVAD